MNLLANEISRMPPLRQPGRLRARSTSLPVASAILNAAIYEAKRTLSVFGIQVEMDSSLPDPEKDSRPYLATQYNRDDLGDINIVAYRNELLDDHKLLGQDEFATRVRTGFREEAIHCVQILSAKLKYEKLSAAGLTSWETASGFFYDFQERLFRELVATTEGSELLIASARLYYGDPGIDSTDAVRELDVMQHGGEGYITVELGRQIVQARLGEPTSEEGRGDAWDKNRRFSLGGQRNPLAALSQVIRFHAVVPEEVSPLLAAFVSDTEALLLSGEHTQRSSRSAEAAPVW